MSATLPYYKDSSLNDAARRLTRIEHMDANDVVIYQLDYDWSLNNLVKSRTETRTDGTWFVEFEYDKRNRLSRETRTKTSVDPDVVEYDIEYEYDQLGNRTLKTDHVAERMTVYSYDVDYDPNQLAYPTHHNRLLWYELYDTSDPNAAQLLRTVRYTYYDTGQASNITVTDEVLDPNGNQWHHDLALHYYTHGLLRLAVWGRWLEDQTGRIPSSYEVLKAKEFRYDDPRARYIAADIVTPTNSEGSWYVDGDIRWTDYEGVTPYADCDVDADTAGVTDQHSRYFGLAGEQDLDPNGAPTASAYWHEDLIGSTMQATGAGGTGHSPVSYTAFGEPVGDFSGMPRYQYAGGWGYESDLLGLDGHDSGLPPIALQHLGWRWYQPEIGRFVQRDPLGLAGGLSCYLYISNQPVLAVDPTGLQSAATPQGMQQIILNQLMFGPVRIVSGGKEVIIVAARPTAQGVKFITPKGGEFGMDKLPKAIEYTCVRDSIIVHNPPPGACGATGLEAAPLLFWAIWRATDRRRSRWSGT